MSVFLPQYPASLIAVLWLFFWQYSVSYFAGKSVSEQQVRAAGRLVQWVNTVAQIYLQWLAVMLVTRFKLATQPEFEVSGVSGEE